MKCDRISPIIKNTWKCRPVRWTCPFGGSGSSGHSWFLIIFNMNYNGAINVWLLYQSKITVILMAAQGIPDFSWTMKNDSNRDIDLLRQDGFLIMIIMILLWCIIMIKNTFSGLMQDMPQMPSQRQSFRLFWQSLSDKHFATQLKKWKFNLGNP